MTNKVNEKTSDLQLIKEILKSGDEAALSILYERYFLTIYKFVYSRTHDKETTEDIVSETWLTLIHSLSKFNGSSQFSTFALGFALNILRAHFRKNSNLSAEVELENIPNPEDSKTSEKLNVLKNNLNEILTKLSENYRNILHSRFIEGLSIKECALKYNLTEANVKVIQHRAIKEARALAESYLK